MSMCDAIKIIAECGINHNGSLARAKEMVDIAVGAGVDFVKFQVFNTENLVKKEAPLAKYQKENSGQYASQFELLKQYELTKKEFTELHEYCLKKNIAYLATPFDFESLYFLNTLDIEYVKVSSGDLTNGPLLFKIARLNKKVILSTGMASLDEVFHALSVLHYGYSYKCSQNPLSFDDIISISKLQIFSELSDKVIVLHCTSDYPAQPDSLNLRAIQTLKNETQLPVGYSDHSMGIHMPVAAVALGACVIEKHFTLDKNLPGPDHRASINADELCEMVKNIKDIELALGTGHKKMDTSEIENSRIVRKGLYARKKIRAGDLIEEDSVAILRPETDTSPMLFWDKVGRTAEKEYEIGDPL